MIKNHNKFCAQLNSEQIKQLENLREIRIKRVVESHHRGLRLMWDPIHNLFINQDDYYRDLTVLDCESYLIPSILRAKKMFGETKIFLEALVVYMGTVLWNQLPHGIVTDNDRKMALQLENIVFSGESEEDILQQVFSHHFWSMQSFTFREN